MNEDDDFNKLIQTLQKKIDEKEESIYSKKVIEEYRKPIYFGKIKKPDASAKIKGSCGDTMKIDLKIKNQKIIDTRFWTDGCGASIACGNMLSKMIKGKTIEKAEKITNKKILKELDGLPDEHKHCSVLCIDTLKKCIKNYYKK